MLQIHELLDTKRKRLGLTASQVAAGTGLGITTTLRVLKGKTSPHRSTMMGLLDFLKLPRGLVEVPAGAPRDMKATFQAEALEGALDLHARIEENELGEWVLLEGCPTGGSMACPVCGGRK